MGRERKLQQRQQDPRPLTRRPPRPIQHPMLTVTLEAPLRAQPIARSAAVTERGPLPPNQSGPSLSLEGTSRPSRRGSEMAKVEAKTGFDRPAIDPIRFGYAV